VALSETPAWKGRAHRCHRFARGLRIVDIANPHVPREVASFVPPVAEGTRGMHILERT